ncbi:hypothetical protein PINS_up020701 [Pythium insidiosum]|nr:hypothetical protein PINS_up020701 [Pythium insidiosum]
MAQSDRNEDKADLFGVRISSVDISRCSDEIKEVVAQSRIRMTDSNERQWLWLLQTPATAENDDNEEIWKPEKTLLATANVTRLRVRIKPKHDERCRQLLQVLRDHATAVTELHLRYDDLHHYKDEERRCKIQELTRALLSSHSHLRLKSLALHAALDPNDLETMTEWLENEKMKAMTTPRDRHPLRQLVCKWWQWHADTRRQHNSFTKLLELIGGVDSLRIEGSRVPAMEIATLAISCRQIDASVSCTDWQESLNHDNKPLGALRLQQLRLEIVEADAARVKFTLLVLLRLVGQCLESLSLRCHIDSMDDETVAMLLELCPTLQELHLDQADASFDVARRLSGRPRAVTDRRVRGVLNLVDSIPEAERLESLQTTRLAPLFSVLCEPTHSLTKRLRSLRLAFYSESAFDHQQTMLLRAAIQELLMKNTRLQDVTIISPVNDDLIKATDVAPPTAFAVVHAPLGYRLAMLSALHQFNLPRGVLESILTMAARAQRRLRVINLS